MKSSIRGLTLIVLGLISGAAQAGEFKHVPLSQVMAGNATPTAAKDANEPAITIPTHYISKKVDGAAMPAVVLGASADVEAVMPAWKFSDIKEGIFTINISPNRSYDVNTRKFAGESPDAVKEYESHGFKNAKIRREDTGGIPILTLTSEKEGRPNYLAFFAIGSSVMAVNYVPPTPATADDNKRWETFIKGLNPANLK